MQDSAGILRFLHNIWSVNSIFVHNMHVLKLTTKSSGRDTLMLLILTLLILTAQYAFSWVKIAGFLLLLEKRKKSCHSSVFMHLFNFKDNPGKIFSRKERKKNEIMECEKCSLGPLLHLQQFQSINKMAFLWSSVWLFKMWAGFTLKPLHAAGCQASVDNGPKFFNFLS